MTTYVYPADEHGCGYHRLIWPAQQLRAGGHDVRIVMPKDRNAAFRGALDDGGNLTDVTVPPDADVVVLQRITHRHIVDAIHILRGRGTTVVIDMDDDLASIDPRNPAFIQMHPTHGTHKDHSWQNAQRACEAASYVTVSTDALLRIYAPHGRGQVLRNCVPGRYLGIPRVDSDVIGWAGSLHSHPDDLQVVGTAVAQVVREAGTRFHVVGDGVGVRAALRLDEEPVAAGPQDPHVGWPAEIAKIGVGITPLAPTRFNTSKSWLKPLEFAALGVPCVMSPAPEYSLFSEQGAGWLASKPKQWRSHLRALVSSADLRAELSAAGREVAARWTVEGNAWRWADAWDAARKVDG